MSRARIRDFQPGDRQSVVDLILGIQREEFGIAITADDQPDLAAIGDFYQVGAGGFWVAEVDGSIVGTIALKEIGGSRGALRKMFVAPSHRGREAGVARLLLARLLANAAGHGMVEIILGTTEILRAAHRFYEKNGFTEIGKEALPLGFPLMAVDTKFYALRMIGAD